jgi:hypothetical protein
LHSTSMAPMPHRLRSRAKIVVEGQAHTPRGWLGGCSAGGCTGVHVVAEQAGDSDAEGVDVAGPAVLTVARALVAADGQGERGALHGAAESVAAGEQRVRVRVRARNLQRLVVQVDVERQSGPPGGGKRQWTRTAASRCGRPERRQLAESVGHAPATQAAGRPRHRGGAGTRSPPPRCSGRCRTPEQSAW